MIRPPWPPKCLDYRREPPCLAQGTVLIGFCPFNTTPAIVNIFLAFWHVKMSQTYSWLFLQEGGSFVVKFFSFFETESGSVAQAGMQ